MKLIKIFTMLLIIPFGTILFLKNTSNANPLNLFQNCNPADITIEDETIKKMNLSGTIDPDSARRFILESIKSQGVFRSRTNKIEKYKNLIIQYEFKLEKISTQMNIYPAINDKGEDTYIIEFLKNGCTAIYNQNLAIFDYGTAGIVSSNSPIHPDFKYYED